MVYAGAHILAEDQPNNTLQCIGDILYIRKPIAESVASSTVVQNDDDLSFVLPVGTFEILMWLHVTAAEAADIKVVHTFSGTTTSARSCIGAALGVTDREDTNAIFRGVTSDTEQSYGVDATGTTVVHEAIHTEVSVTGTWQVQWAQVASSATNTTCSIASRVRVMRLE
jgi:hypothetical protein